MILSFSHGHDPLDCQWEVEVDYVHSFFLCRFFLACEDRATVLLQIIALSLSIFIYFAFPSVPPQPEILRPALSIVFSCYSILIPTQRLVPFPPFFFL